MAAIAPRDRPADQQMPNRVGDQRERLVLRVLHHNPHEGLAAKRSVGRRGIAPDSGGFAIPHRGMATNEEPR